MYSQYAYYAASNETNSSTKVLAKNENEARKIAAENLDTYESDVQLRCLGFGKKGELGIIEIL